LDRSLYGDVDLDSGAETNDRPPFFGKYRRLPESALRVTHTVDEERAAATVNRLGQPTVG
jgi:hypothetical protein